MADIFLSYSRVDTDKAMIIKDALEALGLEVFFDVEGLDSGDVFPDVLDREVKAAGAVLSVWSSTSINRPWVKKECGIAMERGVLVPVQIEPISLMDMPAAFFQVQYTDLENFSGEADHVGWKRTVRALARLLDRPDLIKTRKKQVADKERARKLEEKLKAKDAELERVITEGGGFQIKQWHWALGLVAISLLVGGAVLTATSVQSVRYDTERARLERQFEDLFASTELKDFDEETPDAVNELAKILERVPVGALERASETDGRAALLLAWMYDLGEGGVEQDLKRAFEYYNVSCEFGVPRGCRNQARHYRDGESVEQDYAQAARLYGKACDGGSMRGCASLALLYSTGTGVVQDHKESFRLNKIACDGGNMRGCTNLGVKYTNGEGVERDFENAVQLYRKACDGLDVNGCANLGVMLANGHGVERDLVKAQILFKKACAGDVKFACEQLE